MGLPRLVNGRDPAIAGAGQGAGAFHDLAQHGIEIEARADAQNGRAQLGEALAKHPYFRFHLAGFIHLGIIYKSCQRAS